MIIRILKYLVVMIFLFQAWFTQAWFYPPSFADWRARTVAEKYLIKSCGSADDLELGRVYSQTSAPGILSLSEVYGGSLRRSSTWTYGGQGCESLLEIRIAPSGEIYIGNPEYYIAPSTSFDTIRFEGT